MVTRYSEVKNWGTCINPYIIDFHMLPRAQQLYLGSFPIFQESEQVNLGGLTLFEGAWDMLALMDSLVASSFGASSISATSLASPEQASTADLELDSYHSAVSTQATQLRTRSVTCRIRTYIEYVYVANYICIYIPLSLGINHTL